MGLKEKAEATARECRQVLEELRENFTTMLQLKDRRIAELEKQLAAVPKPAVKKGLKMLLIDDAESTHEIVAEYLKQKNVQLTAIRGEKAMSAQLGEFEVIMVEAACGVKKDIDGLELCRRLAGKGWSKRLVVLSSRPGEEIKQLAEEKELLFLRKPFRRSDLIAVLKHILDANKG
ncbi:MAG: response regulator transcription factor [Planctomycetes bacterium]|nr:response regulator transcription factor [Planctomycetota bacterium]